MKISLFTFTLAALFAITSTARADYEITMSVITPDSPEAREVVAKVKGERMHAILGEGTAQIADYKTGQRLLLDDKTKQATDITALVEGSAERKDTNKPKPALVPTGKKESVAGHIAEIFTCDLGGDMVLDLWVTADYPKEQAAAVATLFEFAGPQTILSLSDLAALPGVIIRMVGRNKGVVDIDFVIKSVKVTTVEDKEFEIPAGYTLKKFPAR